jgi:DNA-binding MarR family transcriptional regulator/N-acetylglutamate synthase-like GNAT family acetyltransferase
MEAAMSDAGFEQRIAAVRRFSRFYTQKIGVLQEGLLASPYSLAQVRVLYELAHRDRPSASELARDLGLDAGYLSRILAGFARSRLLAGERSTTDKRKSRLALTEKGRRAFAPLDQRSRNEIGAWLGALPRPDQERLVEAMATIERLTGAAPAAKAPYLLRPHRPGDIGWVIGRHGALYAGEYGWDDTFEALVAEIAAKFVRGFDAKRERCWIAECNGANAGSIYLVRKSATVAQIRLLLVEPSARGLGIGDRLVEECIAFARRSGYRKIVLWTNDILHTARRIYERKGFRLVEEERHHSFGKDLVGQIWDLKL